MMSERAERKVEWKIETITPVTCSMMKKLQIEQGKHSLDGIQTDKFHIVGQIQHIDHIRSTVQFTIDDGTELIKITEAESIVNEAIGKGSTKYNLSSYISCTFELA